MEERLRLAMLAGVPDEAISIELEQAGMFEKFQIKKSRCQGAMRGLFTKKRTVFEVGDVLGNYTVGAGGQFILHVGACAGSEYMMKLQNDPPIYVDGTPSGKLDRTCMALINDPYHNRALCNVRIASKGVIVVTKRICGVSEIYMSYPDNNWDALKLVTVRAVGRSIAVAATALSAPFASVYASECDGLIVFLDGLCEKDLPELRLSGNGIVRLLLALMDGYYCGPQAYNQYSLADCLHSEYPAITVALDSFVNWLERLLRCIQSSLLSSQQVRSPTTPHCL